MDDKVLDYMRALIIKSVGRARSGHPGGALSGLDFTYLLYSEYLSFDPDCDKWFGRDRFVLSAGHMSILQYVILRAVGWLSDKDLMDFRKLYSKTPGHPEVNHTRGIECTTGPLGKVLQCQLVLLYQVIIYKLILIRIYLRIESGAVGRWLHARGCNTWCSFSCWTLKIK